LLAACWPALFRSGVPSPPPHDPGSCRRHDIVCQRDDPATVLYAIVEPGLDQMQVCLAGISR
jgi:hypothetical protein